MKYCNAFKPGRKLVAGGGSFLAVPAFADVPASATDALTSATTDVGTIGWAVFAVLIAAMAFKYMRRAL